ncbi:hypothetical protein MMC34_000089 [Xylographa carneopallida]|nr:hypothetical protein [Xylographa carneopallida]
MTLFSPTIACIWLQLLTVLLSSQLASARPSSIWAINIDEDPAPSPEDGPPLSAHAIRDKAFLPLELGAVFGAYVLAIIVIGSAAFTVGRRLRRSAQTSPRTLAMEMMRPGKAIPLTNTISPSQSNPWGPSPVSPADTKQMWSTPDISRGQAWARANPHQKQPSVQSSVLTFNESVIEEDKSKNEIEMARLYAAVLEHDEKKKSRSLTNAQPLAQHPPELQHLRRTTTSPLHSPPLPPEPMSPVSPSRTSTKSPSRTVTASPQRQTRAFRPAPISVTSPTSHSRASSRTSLGSFGRKSTVRNLSISLPISPPMGSPEIREDHMREYDDSEPLTPREYNPGPPPLPPYRENSVGSEQQRDLTSPKRLHFSKHFAPSIRSSRTSVAGTPLQSPRSPRTPNIPTFVMTHESVGNLPQQLQEHSEEQYHQRQLVPKTQRKPAPLPLRTNLTSDSQHTLPLRTAPLPLRNLGTPGFHRPQSTIKATVLETKPNLLRAPGTGVPSTPYSPFYFPSTPLTPMTPSRLVTREERKRRKKEEGRRVATFEDAVIEEKDMWGDAY